MRDVLSCDILDEALIEEHSLITGVHSDQVRLNGSTSLLSTGVATLLDLVRAGVVDPSYLRSNANVDKDDLKNRHLATVSEMIDAGLIAPADLQTSALALEALDRTGALRISSLDDLDQIVSLGLVTSGEADSYTPDLFGLTGYAVSLAGDYSNGGYSLQLAGAISAAEAVLEASVNGSFDLLAVVQVAPPGPTWGVRDFTLTATVSYDVTGLEVAGAAGIRRRHPGARRRRSARHADPDGEAGSRWQSGYDRRPCLHVR